jgi:4-hydroxybenzoate polyprenyltransferase
MESLKFIKAYLQTSRSEYLLAEIPALFAIFFLSATSFTRLFNIEVFESLIVFVLLYFVGFIINAYSDQEIDKKYDIFKNKIPGAVKYIGENTIKWIIIAQVVLAFMLTAHISFIMNSYLPIFLVTIGTFFGLAYSIPPFHFKVKGIFHAVSLIISAFLVPAVFLYYVIAQHIAIGPLIIIFGFSILHYGIAFANQVIDYQEDKAEGVQTPPVRWGLVKSLKIALWIIFIGLIIELAGFFLFIEMNPAFLTLHPAMTPLVLFLLFVPIIVLGYYIPINGLWRMYKTALTKPVDESIRYMKSICQYNQWQASGLIGAAVVTGLLFFGTLFNL